jgi:hypothetical protein
MVILLVVRKIKIKNAGRDSYPVGKKSLPALSANRSVCHQGVTGCSPDSEQGTKEVGVKLGGAIQL